MMLDFTTTYILENDHILLRPLRDDDREHLLPYAINEPEIWKFNAGGAAGGDNLMRYMETAMQQKHAGREYSFIVFDKTANTYVGSTRFYDYQQEKKTIQLGYTWYGKNYQGTLVNKNCKFLLLEFAFGKLELERVGFAANADNERSINAMKSIGCTVEGILRNNSIDAGNKRINTVVLSILRSEWKEHLKQRLRNKINPITIDDKNTIYADKK